MIKKSRSANIFCVIFMAGLIFFLGQTEKRIQLWPEIETFEKDYLQVSELLRIWLRK